MAKIKILQYPDSRLHKKAIFVDDVLAPEIQQIIDDIMETVESCENCAALAASQMDIPNPPCLTVINSTEEQGELLCLINPEILAMRDFVDMEEGCMSVFPEEIKASVKRAKFIKVKAQDRTGKFLEFEVEGYLAHVIQHEVDHLNGVLYIDKLSPLKRERLEKKMAKLQKK
jgi:peptide deformylase